MAPTDRGRSGPGAAPEAARAAPASAAPAAARRRTRWWLEALTLVWLLWLYDAISNLAPLRLQAALAHAGSILHLEQSLHLDPELALDRWLAAHHVLGLLVSDYYDNAHFVVTLTLLGLLWWRGADTYRPLRNALMAVNVLAFAVFWRYPVAPPRMLAGFTDVVEATHAIGSWHGGALATHADELAAMPSLHIAWAAWSALALWRLTQRRWLRAAGVLYPCLTAFTVLATGNHFVLDIVGGLATFALALALVAAAGRMRAWRGRPAAVQLRALRRRRPPGRYRLSQTCYEVQDQLD